MNVTDTDSNTPTRSRRAQWLGLLGWLLLGVITAGIGAAASVDAATFYAQLTQPVWAPPAWLFGPAWTLLFTLMSIAAWLVWRRTTLHSTALRLYLIQLIANALWSWLFFGWHLGAVAFVEVLILLTLIVATTISFARHHRGAAWLMVPYVLWVSFASALNFSVWQLNPGLL